MRVAQKRLVRVLTPFICLFFSVIPALFAAVNEPGRYLILIDLPSEMARREPDTVQTVYDLVRSGFDGRIQRGEKFELYFNGSRIEASSPFTWNPKRADELAKNATNLFAGRVYDKAHGKEIFTTPLLELSPHLTVFILTDGFQPVIAAPFYTSINSTLDQHRAKFAEAEMPFVVTLLAENGRWTSATVQTNLDRSFELARTAQSMVLGKAVSIASSASTKSTLSVAHNPIDAARMALRNAVTDSSRPAVKSQFQPQLEVAFPENPPPAPIQKPKPPAETLVAKRNDVVATPPPSFTKKREPVKTPPPAELPKAAEKTVIAESYPEPRTATTPVTLESPPQPTQVPPEVIEEYRQLVRIGQMKNRLATAVIIPPTRQSPWPVFAMGIVAVLGIVGLIRYRKATQTITVIQPAGHLYKPKKPSVKLQGQSSKIIDV